jgi:hypothetical protein
VQAGVFSAYIGRHALIVVLHWALHRLVRAFIMLSGTNRDPLIRKQPKEHLNCKHSPDNPENYRVAARLKKTRKVQSMVICEKQENSRNQQQHTNY